MGRVTHLSLIFSLNIVTRPHLTSLVLHSLVPSGLDHSGTSREVSERRVKRPGRDSAEIRTEPTE